MAQNRYNFENSAAKGAEAFRAALVAQAAEKRQAMLDEMNRQVQEQNIAASKENTASLAETRQASAEGRKLATSNLVAGMLQKGQEISPATAGLMLPEMSKQGPTTQGAEIGNESQMGGVPTYETKTPTVFAGTAAENKKDAEFAAFMADPHVDPALKQAIAAEHNTGVKLPAEAFTGGKHSPMYTEWQDAVNQGYKGDFTQYQNEDANRKKSTTNINMGSLDPSGVDMAAQMYAKTGIMPALGMGGGPLRAQILNRAAQYDAATGTFSAGGEPPDVASAKAGYAADTAALKGVQVNYDAVTAFGRNAEKNGKLLDKVIKDVPNTGIPWLNTPVRRLSSQLLGSTAMAQLNAIRQSVQNEYARINSQANLTQTLTDTARKEYESILAPDATPQQIYAALHILSQEYDNRRESYTEQIGEIKGRMNPKGATPTATPDHGLPVQEWTKDKNGNPVPVSGAQ